jgi:hypothetical protein
MTARKAKARTTLELDLLELLEHSRRSDKRLADAVTTVLCRADAKTLAALGIVLEFVAMWATKGPR